jgi:hypothetical protein
VTVPLIQAVARQLIKTLIEIDEPVKSEIDIC